MAEPLALPFPKDPSTTSPTACRLCVYFVCEMALRKNLDIVACTGTMPSVEPSDSNKRRGTLDAVWYKWEVRPVLLPQQLHCFWLRRSQFRHNKCTLQLDLVSGNFHTYTYNFQSRFYLMTQSLWPMHMNAKTHSSRKLFHTSILWISAHENTRKPIPSQRPRQDNFVVILNSFIRLKNQVTKLRVVKRTRHKK